MAFINGRVIVIMIMIMLLVIIKIIKLLYRGDFLGDIRLMMRYYTCLTSTLHMTKLTVTSSLG